METKSLDLPVLLPAGPECERCTARLQEELGRVKGVARAAVSDGRTALRVTYDPNVVTLSRIEAEARRIGAGLDERIDHQTVELRDLDCPDCAAGIEKAVGRMRGVLWASANFAAGQLFVEHESGAVTFADLRRLVESHGVRACRLQSACCDACEDAQTPGWRLWLEERRRGLATFVSVALTLLAAALGAEHQAGAARAVYAAAIVAGGWSTARAGWMALRARAVDMNVLMTLAVMGAAGIGDWFEAATVVVLYNVGNLLQAQAMERTRRSIRALMDLSPKRARVRRAGVEAEIAAEEVRAGDTVLVRPGERIPMDGIVTEGASAVNEAPITGESLPAEKAPGARVFAGTLNGEGYLEFTAACAFRDTTLAKIIHRVEEAQAQRAPAQQFIDRFAARYTPIVVSLAAAIAVLPPLFVGHWSGWFVRALSLLIIACPCALVISTPVAIVTAIGNASRNGALIKGGQYLEALGGLRAVLYDKTGTLTAGRFRVEEVIPLDSLPREDILRTAAALEARSQHPLASAFVAAASGPGAQPLPEVSSFHAHAGHGVHGEVEGAAYVLGNAAMMAEHEITLDGAREHMECAAQKGRTAVVLAGRGAPLGVIVLADTPRTDVAGTVADLRALGMARQAMLTGDNARTAAAVAQAAGLDDAHAGLLPDDKLAMVRDYQRRYGPVGMVGDGVNDAPALAAADVGIVMGAAGSDTAMETADVALMADDLSRLPYLVRLSRRTRGVVRQNVAFSLATKAALIGAAVTVGLPLWLAVMGDVGVSLLVTLNAIRLRS